MRRVRLALIAISVAAGTVILGGVAAGLHASARADMAPNAQGSGANAPPVATLVFDNFNTHAVSNDPSAATTFTLATRSVVTWVRTYHWNDGRGTIAGNVYIVGADGRVWGQWAAQGRSGQAGVRDIFWDATPAVILDPGTYTIRDSDPATWSHNAASGHAGFAQVKGYSFPAPDSAAILPPPLLTRIIAPANAPQVVRHERITVTIPGGALRQHTELRISSISNPPPPPSRFVSSLGAFDVSLGNLHEFDSDIEIAIPVDAGRVPPGGPGTAVPGAAYHDTASGRWVELPTYFNRADRTLVARTRHLSVIEWFWYFSGAYARLPGERCFVLYHPKDISKNNMRGYNANNPRFDPSAQTSSYAQDLLLFADAALKRYADAGLLPWQRPVPIFIEGTSAPVYFRMPGRLQMPTNQRSPSHLNYAAAHESFHAIQQADYPWFEAWDRLYPSNHVWWLEATAEYAASRVAMEKYDGMGNPDSEPLALHPRHLAFSLDTFGKSPEPPEQRFHQYMAAWFIDFVCRQMAPTAPAGFFFDMYKFVAGRSVVLATVRMPPLWTPPGGIFPADDARSVISDAVPGLMTLASKTALPIIDAFLRSRGQRDGLDGLYRRYALYYLFDGQSPMTRLGAVGGDVHPMALEGTPGILRGGTDLPVRVRFALGKNHTARVHMVSPEPAPGKERLRVRAEIVGAVLPGRTAVFLCKTPRGNRVPVETVVTFTGNGAATTSTEITLRTNELLYVVGVNDGPSNADITVLLTPLEEQDGPGPAPDRRRLLTVRLNGWATYDRIVRANGTDWGSGWKDWGTEHPVAIPENGAFSQSATYGRLQTWVSGEINRSRVVWLAMKGIETRGGGDSIGHEWNFRIENIPVQPPIGTPVTSFLYVADAVIMDTTRPHNMDEIVRECVYERTFKDGQKQTLDHVNWNYVTGPGRGGADPFTTFSVNNQSSFVEVRVDYVDSHNRPVPAPIR